MDPRPAPQMKSRPGQRQGTVLLAYLVPFSIDRTEWEGGFTVLELCCVEIVLGFEI